MNAQLCWVSEQALELRCDRTEVSVQLTLRPVLAELLSSPCRGDSGPGCSTRNLIGIIGFSQLRGTRVWIGLCSWNWRIFTQVTLGKVSGTAPCQSTHMRVQGSQQLILNGKIRNRRMGSREWE